MRVDRVTIPVSPIRPSCHPRLRHRWLNLLLHTSILKSVRQIVQRILSRFGYQIVYYGKGNAAPLDPLNAFLTALRGLGFNPKHIIDVGANRGVWTRTVSRYFPTAHYTLMEPQIRFRNRVKDIEQAGISITWLHAGAGDKHGRLMLHVPTCDTSASFVPITESADGKVIDRLEVDILPLDDVVARSPHPMPDLVKIDAEGFDIRVIEGAKSLHGKTEVFMVEVAVFDRKAENTLLNTISIMDRIGYAPLDITDMNRCAKSGVLWLIEVPFLRKDSALWARIPPYLASFRPD